MIEVGKSLKVDKMLTGSVEYFGEVIIVSLRLIDIGTETIEKSKVLEFVQQSISGTIDDKHYAEKNV